MVCKYVQLLLLEKTKRSLATSVNHNYSTLLKEVCVCIIIIQCCHTLALIVSAVPSGPPQSFTGYLSHLHNSAKFRWSAVDTIQTNGLLIGYNFSCNVSSTSGTETETINDNFDSGTFEFELADIVENAEYECTIAASTQAGKGPDSAPIYFTTPGNIEGTHITSYIEGLSCI